MPIALVLGLLGGAIAGYSKSSQMQSEYEDTLEGLQETQEDLTTARTNLQEDYKAQVGEGLINVDDYLSQEGFDISQVSYQDIGLQNYKLLLEATEQNRLKGITTELQARALKTSTASSVMQSGLETQQLAELNVQTAQAEGQAVQAVASSGFRKSGSALSVISNQQQTNRMATQSLQGQINLTRFNRYNNALSAYTQSEIQKAGYDAAIQNQVLLTSASIDEMTRQYERDMQANQTSLERVGEDIEEMIEYKEDNSLAYSQLGAFWGSVLTGGLSTL